MSATDGATDRGVVRLGSQHQLCGSEPVAYSSANLCACWWRSPWTSVVTATVTYLSFELILTVFFLCWKLPCFQC